jgi:hypothetical protein
MNHIPAPSRCSQPAPPTHGPLGSAPSSFPDRLRSANLAVQQEWERWAQGEGRAGQLL